MTTTITPELRRTGVDVVGDMPWGTHFCLFYDTKAFGRRAIAGRAPISI